MAKKKVKEGIKVETKFRKIRKEKELSQKKVAELANISPSTYVKIESGDTEHIYIEMGKKISGALGISFNELFDIDTPESTERIRCLESEIAELQKANDRLNEKIAFQEKLIASQEKNILLLSKKVDIN